MRRLLSLVLIAAACNIPSVARQSHALATPADPLVSLDFLLGTWSAKTNTPAGSAGAQVIGTYSFHRDLGGHVLSRTSSADTCKAPKSFDCQHNDQLTIFADSNAQTVHNATLFALYLDSEGHVIYYSITTPDPHTAIFTSQSAPGAPHFKLVYHLEGEGAAAMMTGKFQGSAPGSDEFHSYLEWSGTKQ